MDKKLQAIFYPSACLVFPSLLATVFSSEVKENIGTLILVFDNGRQKNKKKVIWLSKYLFGRVFS
jgi:hypothetical protein